MQLNFSDRIGPRDVVNLAVLFVAVFVSPAVGAAEPIERLAVFKVTGERFEEFGFRVSPERDFERSPKGQIISPVVDLVLPNTAASKAGLRPGDRILAADGKSTAGRSMSLGAWQHLQNEKWEEIARGTTGLTWTLEVETSATGQLRKVVLQLPTPAPHWGATEWRQPLDRIPVSVPETGPLAERAEQILNHGIWMILRGIYVKAFGLPIDAAHPHFLSYQWTIWEGDVGHRMYVSRQRGRTDIVLEVIYHSNAPIFRSSVPTALPDESLGPVTTVLATDSATYLTSPSGVLEAGWRLHWLTGRQNEIPRAAAKPAFEAEVDFWLNRVGKTSPLWPLGLKPATKNIARP